LADIIFSEREYLSKKNRDPGFPNHFPSETERGTQIPFSIALLLIEKLIEQRNLNKNNVS